MPKEKQASKNVKSTTKRSRKATDHVDENYSVIAGILAGLIIVLGGGLLWSNQQRIIQVLDQPSEIVEEIEEEDDEFALFIGKEIAVSGFIISDEEDTYISTSEYGIIGLENINEFGDLKQGEALIGGTISSFVNNSYFMTINTFSGGVVDIESEEEEEIVIDNPQDVVFVAQAGIRFNDLLANDIVVQSNTNQQFITVRKKDSSNKITINYFQCITGHKSYDCKKETERLQKSKNLEKAYTTNEDDVIYRIKKTNQRYGSIDGRYGYYMSSNSQKFVQEVLPLMDFMSDKFITKYIAPQLTNICIDQGGQYALTKITSRNQLFFDDLLSIDVIGKDSNNKGMQCLVVVDLNSPLGGSLISLDYLNAADRPDPLSPEELAELNEESDEEEENIDEEESTEEEEMTDEDLLEEDMEELADGEDEVEVGNSPVNYTTPDPSVEQFRLKLEDPFIHTFNAGYTVHFPSKNISFGSKNVGTTLDLDSTNCYIRTDVIDYPNRELKHETPAVSVYVCTTTLGADSVGNYLYIPSNTDKKAYLVEINDPSWVDFATHIKIED